MSVEEDIERTLGHMETNIRKAKEHYDKGEKSRAVDFLSYVHNASERMIRVIAGGSLDTSS